MKLTISAWPGAGGTTLCLILAKRLNLKYLSVGSIFRELGKRMELSDTGEDRYKADEVNERKYGKDIDDYVVELLLDNEVDNIIVDSDITAFRTGIRDEFFSVFLTADREAILSRLKVDGRDDDIEVWDKRIQHNEKFYRALFGIEWLDIAEIENNYNLRIDNSRETIADEIRLICEVLATLTPNVSVELRSIGEDAEAEEKLFWKNGKKWYLDYLEAHDLMINPEEILKKVL